MQLLEKDPQKRIGSSEQDFKDIMQHAFFEDLNWEKLEKKQITPRYKPVAKSVVQNNKLSYQAGGEEYVPKISDVTGDIKKLIKAHNDNFKGLTTK